MTYFMSSHGRKTLTQSVIRHADIESKRLNLLLSSQHRMAAYDLFSYTPPRLHDTTGWVVQPVNRLHRVYKHSTG